MTFQTLDEVDFTVLAATSVLGDLMHKCPPAEACRDAFERMSKATVQMCMSTTGFGSQVDMTRVHASHGGSSLYTGRSRQPMGQRRRTSQGQARQTTQPRLSRPLPKFDMNLADLFNDNIPLTEQAHADHGPSEQPFSDGPEQTEGVPPAPAFADSQRTPPMEFFMKYENPPSPQQPPQFFFGDSPQRRSSLETSAHNANNGPRAIPPGDLEGQPGISLDFLDFAPSNPDHQVDLDAIHSADHTLGAMPPLGPNLGSNVGIDLGFGMAMDFQHDWSENPSYDLLEGYFFGGSGNGASGDDL